MGKGFDTFMANPYWRRIYEEAPSEELKEYYRIRYDTSPFVMGKDHCDKEAEARLEKLPLSKTDIEYIRRYAGSGMARRYYDRCIQRLTGEYEGWCLPAAAFRSEVWNPWYDPGKNPAFEDDNAEKSPGD